MQWINDMILRMTQIHRTKIDNLYNTYVFNRFFSMFENPLKVK